MVYLSFESSIGAIIIGIILMVIGYLVPMPNIGRTLLIVAGVILLAVGLIFLVLSFIT